MSDNVSRFRFRKLRFEDAENPPAKFRYVAGSRIPEDLPIQIKICMHDPVPYRHDLPPRHFRVALSRFSGQTADRLADHRQMVKYRCRYTSSLRNESSLVAATIVSILRQAERMSFRNDGSCRIDDPGILENLRPYPWLQSALGNHIDLALSQRLQLPDEGLELD